MKKKVVDYSHVNRYMVLQDAGERIQKLWREYSPKLYDGSMVKARRGWFDEKLGGAKILADTHFESANAELRDPYFTFRSSKSTKTGPK